ncbi:class I SAM-dependent methyltransferase [Parasulfuritortus cantonensis]|uniref:Class I SAM-dependent methyltransferase n=1 Tax=Parasulfuritortus cantonensis TaxID=2528202 RepID=A0A4R1B797_9PROT|nr:class I SAM-dependent methyltransferase [Parasulfuritortus cantonensis]TCJ11583.1 class I SAM-dependent methyltransferase [Parasulfuritortus cantonensis]
MIDLAAVYDRFADTYEANRGRFDMAPVLADFEARLPAGGGLLDLGCGAGEPFAAHFAARGWQVTGVDFSPRMLDLAARYVPAMTRIRADMSTVDFAPASFDAVVAVYSLFHVPRARHAALFRRIRGWLRPGGHFLFTYATRHYTGAERFEGGKEFLGETLFYSHLGPEELTAALADAGLAVADLAYREIGGETFLWVTARA